MLRVRLLAAMAATAASCVSAQDFLERSAVVMYYHTMYLPTANVPSGWVGNVAACDAGTTSQAFKDAVLARINFYRLLTGLPRVSLFTDGKATDAQNAALLTAANNTINHSPPGSANCYTASGYNGAFNSLLALGAFGPNAVDLYMQEVGAGNSPVQNRRWLLYPPQASIATGDIPVLPQANALWALGPFGVRPNRYFTAWPPPGYVPWDVLPAASNRWSFSIPGAVFGNVGLPPTSSVSLVEKTGPGNVVSPSQPTEILAGGYGDETLVFKPAGVSYSRPAYDRRYEVSVGPVGNVQNGYRQFSTVMIDASELPGGLTGDFDGDGRSDLVWHNPLTGQTSIWLVNGAGFGPGSQRIGLDLRWRPTLTGDFNGDGKADLVFRNDDTGETAIWLMDGAQVLSSTVILAERNWRAVMVGDFNGDGKSDLVWHAAPSALGLTSGIAVWTMSGAQPIGVGSLSSHGVATHVGDLDGNGKDDIVMRSDHITWAFLMNGATPASATQIGGDWNTHVTQIGDFNGDGKADLVWNDRATGTTSMALMSGVASVATAQLLTSADWRVVGTADFNGDGKSDLVWRNRTTGEVAIWLMDGTYFQSGAIVLGLPDWQVAKVGNFNGDTGPGGKPKHDLLWRNSATGEHAIWLMNGYAFTGGAIVLNGTSWWATP